MARYRSPLSLRDYRGHPSDEPFFSTLFSIFRYGSDLVLVESYSENNFTAGLATRSLGPADRNQQHYWLGLASLDDLRTNTLESAAGLLVSQYSGKYFQFSIYVAGKGLVTMRVVDQVFWIDIIIR